MTYKIVLYQEVDNLKNNAARNEYLNMFATGILASKYNISLYKESEVKILDYDIGIIFGYKRPNIKNSKRNKNIDYAIKNNKRLIHIDSNCFSFINLDINNFRRLRFNYDFDYGVFNNNCDIIFNKLNVKPRPIRQCGDHVLFCIQSDRGWSMGNINHVKYINDTLDDIRKFTDRKVIIRFHPRDTKGGSLNKILPKVLPNNVYVSTNRNIVDDLKNVWCTVFYNSSIGFVSIMNGIPTISLDLSPTNQYMGYTEQCLSNIENIGMYNYDKLIHLITIQHFDHEMIKTNEMWDKILEKLIT